jgi:hypothetical protein
VYTRAFSRPPPPPVQRVLSDVYKNEVQNRALDHPWQGVCLKPRTVPKAKLFLRVPKGIRQIGSAAPLMLMLALGGREWSASRPGRFSPVQTPCYPLPTECTYESSVHRNSANPLRPSQVPPTLPRQWLCSCVVYRTYLWLQAPAKSALFWDITQRRVIIVTDVSGQRSGPTFKGREIFSSWIS